MDISSIANQYLSQAALQSSATSPATRTDPVQKAFSSASARLEKERQATSAQISAYGQIKSGFARVEDTGKALAATKSTTGTEDLKKNLQAFVGAYNDARSAAASTDTGGAQAAGRDLRRSLSTDTARADLKSLGITQNQDGSLTLDAKALDKALQSGPDAARSAASRIGSTARQTAGRALGENGSIGSSLNALNSREQGIEARQAAQQQLVNTSQQAVEQTSTRLNNALAGINSYNRVFSL